MTQSVGLPHKQFIGLTLPGLPPRNGKLATDVAALAFKAMGVEVPAMFLSTQPARSRDSFGQKTKTAAPPEQPPNPRRPVAANHWRVSAGSGIGKYKSER
jgi:hypothetical protein